MDCRDLLELVAYEQKSSMSQTAKRPAQDSVSVKGEWTAQVTNNEWSTRATVARGKADKVVTAGHHRGFRCYQGIASASGSVGGGAKGWGP